MLYSFFSQCLFFLIDHQMLLRKAPGNNQFILQHLLGTNPVLYTATGWLKAARENLVTKSAITILQESTRYFSVICM